MDFARGCFSWAVEMMERTIVCQSYQISLWSRKCFELRPSTAWRPSTYPHWPLCWHPSHCGYHDIFYGKYTTAVAWAVHMWAVLPEQRIRLPTVCSAPTLILSSLVVVCILAQAVDSSFHTGRLGLSSRSSPQCCIPYCSGIFLTHRTEFWGATVGGRSREIPMWEPFLVLWLRRQGI